MHGRLKVRTTEEQAERKRLEREKKLKIYKDAMSECVRRIKASEYDNIGMKISEEILANNPDLQTLWNYRKNTLIYFEKPEEKDSNEESNRDDSFIKLYINELALTEICLKKNPKSYGSWYHREWCMLKANQLNIASKSDRLSWKNELQLCNLFLNLDERNFHCWKYRMFVIKNGNLNRLEELEYTFEKICSNFSNYSAWHYRSKLIGYLYYENQISADVFKKELSLIENAVFTDPNDQSAWIYEKWLLLEHQRSFIKELSFDKDSSLIRFKFAREMNLNQELVYLKLNNFFLKEPNNSSLQWLNEKNNPNEGSFDWSQNISCNQELLDFLSNYNQVKIEILFRGSVIPNELLLERTSSGNIFEFKSKFEMKNIQLDNELIEKHLNNLNELLQLEGNNSKWCLLTLVELMCIINYEKYKTTIQEHLSKLGEIDLYRTKFYSDLQERINKNNSSIQSSSN